MMPRGRILVYDMENTAETRTELVSIGRELFSLLLDLKAISGFSEDAVSQWEKSYRQLLFQLTSEKLRMAVVGPIKSGKSTFLNALLNDDYLNRGAGVITSIVTRIRFGEKLKGILHLKGWEEINEEISQAMILLPNMKPMDNHAKFDIQTTQSRKYLQEVLNRLNPEQFFNQGIRDTNTVLLNCFLKGYDDIHPIHNSDSRMIEYSAENFKEHRRFVGNDALSVYLKDVLLEINTSELDNDVELADCQGSDSSNPLHMAMIQDYLQWIHLTIYVISSRIGLRQADIRFLSMIRKMGIIENVIFVVNCDISEHETIEDLNRIVQTIKEELVSFHPNPEIYVFSALYELFKSIQNTLPEIDELRLKQWQFQAEIVEYTHQQFVQFKAGLNQKLSDKRAVLMLKNPIERFGVILSAITDAVGIHSEILSRDEESAHQFIETMSKQVQQIHQIQTMVQSTLSGATSRLKGTMSTDVHNFFDTQSGAAFRFLIDFIRNYSVDLHKYLTDIEETGFLNTLYRVYQEFKQAVETAVTEKVNPEIFRFVRKTEAGIFDDLKNIAESYTDIVDNVLEMALQTLAQLGVSNDAVSQHSQIQGLDLESVKKINNLTPPALVPLTRYSAIVKTEAVVHYGIHNLANMASRLVSKRSKSSHRNAEKALQKGVERMKRLAETSIREQSKNYRENLKFHYLFKLVDAASQQLSNVLLDRFKGYMTDLTTMRKLIETHHDDKHQTIQQLGDIRIKIHRIEKQIDTIKSHVHILK